MQLVLALNTNLSRNSGRCKEKRKEENGKEGERVRSFGNNFLVGGHN